MRVHPRFDIEFPSLLDALLPFVLVKLLKGEL